MCVVPDVSEDRHTFIFRVKQSKMMILGLLDPEEK
jgi:hypothetical protein